MSNIAIIPARGGSKRIPHKNIKDFLGKPIIAYSIEAALQSNLFDEVMVSTDDEEIADVAIRYGAKVPFMRSSSSSNDHATLADVIDEVKREYERLNQSFDYICCILATAPLIKVHDLKMAFETLIKENADSVRPIVRFSYPIQRAVKLDQGRITMFYPEHQTTRSQDLEPAYQDSGQFYWTRYKTGLRGSNKYGYEIKETHVQDIDTMEDWKLAELKYNFLFHK